MNIRGQHIYGWQDFLELAVASWLVISPFVLGFFSQVPASLTAILVGGVAIMFAIMGLATQKIADEWGSIGAAVCLAASPWLFGYAHIEIAAMNALACGIILACLAGLAMLEDASEMRKTRKAERSHI